jgi:hypothetical protein
MSSWVVNLAAIAERHGLLLPEFIIVDVIRTAFPMTKEEVVKFTMSFLPEADGIVVQRCTQKGWLRTSAEGLLEVTPEGQTITEAIARDLHRRREVATHRS